MSWTNRTGAPPVPGVDGGAYAQPYPPPTTGGHANAQPPPPQQQQQPPQQWSQFVGPPKPVAGAPQLPPVSNNNGNTATWFTTAQAQQQQQQHPPQNWNQGPPQQHHQPPSQQQHHLHQPPPPTTATYQPQPPNSIPYGQPQAYGNPPQQATNNNSTATFQQQQQQQPQHPPVQATNNAVNHHQPQHPPQQQQIQQQQSQHVNANAYGMPQPDKFQASAAFDNNASADGWDDFDWDENSSNNNSAAMQQQQQQQQQQQPQQQPPQQAPELYNPQAPPAAQPFQPFANNNGPVAAPLFPPQSLLPTQQPPPPVSSPFAPPPHPSSASHTPQPAAAMQYYAQPPPPAHSPYQQQQQLQSPPPPQQQQLPPSHVPFYQQQPQVPPAPVANIANSFATNADATNWNWQQQQPPAVVAAATNEPFASVLDNAPALFQTVGKEASQKIHSRNASNASNAADGLQSQAPPSQQQLSSPDDIQYTQQQQQQLLQPPPPTTTTAAVAPPVQRAIKNVQQLTPQWSIESQMSHTSSERSMESDALDTRSSNTNSSEDPPFPPNYPRNTYQQGADGQMVSHGFQQQQQQQQQQHDVLQQQSLQQFEDDLLDETLHSLNVDQSQQQQQHLAENTAPAAPPLADIQPYWQPTQFNLNPRPADPSNTDASAFVAHSNPFTAEQPPTLAAPSVDSSENNSYALTSSSSPMTTGSSTSSQQFAPQTVAPAAAEPPPSSFGEHTYAQNVATVAPPTQPQVPAFGAPPTTFTPPPPAAFTQQQQPPPPSGQTSAANPFKRAGTVAHKNPHFQPPAALSPHPPAPLVGMQMHPPAPLPAFMQPTMSTAVIEPVATIEPLPNQELMQPENSEIPLDHQDVNQEIAPHNDRNQYLQTGHLSEENSFAPQSGHMNAYNAPPQLQQHPQQQQNAFAANIEPTDFLPPPGLSRLVLGQPETIHQQASATLAQLAQSQPAFVASEPPPGLDRMVPGTELANSTPMQLERQADGEDTNASPSVRNAPVATPATIVPVAAPLDIDHSSQHIQTTDRNLYLVPGDESDPEPPVQLPAERVVTGHVQPEPAVVAATVTPSTVVPATHEQRELIMDGENLEDDAAVSSPAPAQRNVRNEPLEGANRSDLEPTDLASPADGADGVTGGNTTVLDASPTDQAAQHNTAATNTAAIGVVSSVAPKKYTDGSLGGSTGNDDSDKDRPAAYFNRSAAPPTALRRSEEPTPRSKRRGDKSSATAAEQQQQQRYDTEDTDYYSDREKERRRFGREGSVRRDRDRRDGGGPSSRDRDDGRDARQRRGEEVRDPRGQPLQQAQQQRRETGDRYERERYRYETDGSRYETEDSRYDRRKRGDVDERRDRNGGDRRAGDVRRRDDRYRDDRDYMSDRRRDKGRGDRYYDNDEYVSQRSGSRNALDRPEKGRRYAGQSQQPDAYAYAQQQQQQQQYGAVFDQYHYYQHQQYYENLRRTNPQAYAEFYKQYYEKMQLQQQQQQLAGGSDVAGGGGGPSDGRESVHSGRSSVNDKDRFVRPSSAHHQQLLQQQQQQQHFQHPYYDSNGYPRQQHQQQHQHQQQQQQQSFSQQQNSTLVEGGAAFGQRQMHFASNQSEYSELRSTTRLDALNASDAFSTTAAAADDQQSSVARMTPCKFTIEHSTASLANGLLVSVRPQYSVGHQAADFTSVVRIMQLGANDVTRKLFAAYPGPLARGVTHKKTVIEFCEEQIRLGPGGVNIAGAAATLKARGNSMSSVFSQSQPAASRASYTLMWNLLILLLRQNGVVVGTDISELLLKNRAEFPYETTATASGSAAGSKESSVREAHESAELLNDGDADETRDVADVAASEPQSPVDEAALSEDEVTEKFRNYLLYGSISEALDWATDHNLWGHALFLASKVDRRSHANVLLKFANKMTLNDPLQTLYQLMSGRTPNSVTSIQDERWGDWRPHLAMILANTSPKPELDRKAITTLGDSLYNRGDLFAAQFCYLMAQVGFGRYANVNHDSVLMSNSANAIRLILLGSSHHRAFRDFATSDAIQMTEIYEYACTLNDEHFSIVDFQPYKYLLATRMLDAGLNLKALLYLEQIARHIQRQPERYEGAFVGRVYTLADQLKYFDPVYERMMFEPKEETDEGGAATATAATSALDDQPWLKELQSTLTNNNPTSILQDTNNYINDAIQYQQPDDSLANINQQFAEINQQFSELNLQYTNSSGVVAAQQPAQAALPQQQQYDSLQPSLQPPEPYSLDAYAANAGGYAQPMSLPTNAEHYGYDPNEQQQQVQQQQYYQPEQQQQQQPGEQQSYDYWQQQQQQQQQQQPDQQQQDAYDQTPMPSISMPNSVPKKSAYYDDDEPSSTTGPSSGQAGGKQGADSGKEKGGAVIGANANQSSKANSGWFGGLFNKLSLKPKNQMILPDDKNPAIVWDSDKKKWISSDGGAEETEQFRPPPKMSELAPQLGGGGNAMPPTFAPERPQTAQLPSFGASYAPVAQDLPAAPMATPFGVPSAQSASNAAVDAGPCPANAAKTPNLQSNMFKMQRNRTLKKSYVDVFNPSGAPSKPLETGMMAPLLPATTPATTFFIPGAPVSSAATSAATPEGGSQFYNPNQFAAGAPNASPAYQQ